MARPTLPEAEKRNTRVEVALNAAEVLRLDVRRVGTEGRGTALRRIAGLESEEDQGFLDVVKAAMASEPSLQAQERDAVAKLRDNYPMQGIVLDISKLAPKDLKTLRSVLVALLRAAP